MSDSLKTDFEFYLQNQAEFVAKYRGKYVVIKDRQVIGVYDSELTAVNETAKEHAMGTFLVQKCEPGAESYTQTYHSRVVVS